jgi:hypothetical protein
MSAGAGDAGISADPIDSARAVSCAGAVVNVVEGVTRGKEQQAHE